MGIFFLRGILREQKNGHFMINDSLKRDIMGSVFVCLFVCRNLIELRLSYALKRAKTKKGKEM